MKTLLTTLLALITLTSVSQTRISFTQDAKLAFIGDDIGNDPFTTDITIRATQFLAKDKILNAFTFIDYEIADLEGGLYSKIGFGLGVNFDNWIDKVEFQTMLSSSFINRNGRSYPTWDLIGNISYDLNDKIALLIELQQTKRNDIKTQPFVYSGKIGIRLNIFTKPKDNQAKNEPKPKTTNN